MGQGNFTITDTANSTDTASLNRDVTQTEKEQFDVDRQQGNIDVTVDHRLLTEDGRKVIAEDIERTERLSQSVADVATKESITLLDTLDHIDDIQKDLDVQKSLTLADNGKIYMKNKEKTSVKYLN